MEGMTRDEDEPFQSTLPERGETRIGLPAPPPSCHFNPLSPSGERRGTGALAYPPHPISIHSPRAGRDGPDVQTDHAGDYFNPLSPSGERQKTEVTPYDSQRISIHSPRAGRDTGCGTARRRPRNFNPLSPSGERLHGSDEVKADGEISIHSPRAGRDVYNMCQF